jgi:hypothetical protein
MPEFRAAWRNDKDVLMRKFTGHIAVQKIRDSLDLARDYGVCQVPGALASHEAFIDRLSEEQYHLGFASTQVVFRVTNWSAKPYTTKQDIMWALPPMPREYHPIVWPVWGILQDVALALEDRGHNLTLRRQLEPPPSAVRFDALIDVSPPFGYQCFWVFEHRSWERFGDTWPTGLPRLMPVDDLPADATDDADDDDEDVVWDEAKGFSDTSVDDGSDSATEDDDDDDDEDDVPVMSDEEEVEECWADDF